MFKLLFVSSVSACFELVNEEIYNSKQKFCVILNGKEQKTLYDTNVFSLFDLKPDTSYSVKTTIDDFSLTFKTLKDSVALSVKDFGAKGDGLTDDTHAIQMAIDAIPTGGRVFVPEGTYFVHPLLLKSDVTLHLSRKATLKFSSRTEDYPIWVGEVDTLEGGKFQVSTWEGAPATCYQPCLAAFRCKNVSVVGEGTVDGNGQNGIWWIDTKSIPYGRPRLFFCNDCDNVTLHGITLCNSPSWTVHPYFSRNFNLLDARVNAPKDSPNTDGCNPESCDGVSIIGTIISVGDDCIAIKSGKLYMGSTYKRPANNHTIRNCLMRFGHGAVVLGSEMAGGIKNLTVNRCLFVNTDRGLRIKTRRGRGKDGIIDNVLFENIKMERVLTPLVINMYYFCDPDGKTEYVWSKQPYPVGDDTPYLGSFAFRDIDCEACEVAAGFFYGLPEQPIKKVSLQNVRFNFVEDAKEGKPAMMSFMSSMKRTGLYFNNVKEVNLDNVIFENVIGEEITRVNVDKVSK